MEILITDDHELIRDGLRYMLRQLDEDAIILEACNCTEAVAIAKEHGQLDLILLDLSMQDSDGIEALKILRDCVPSTPIVVVSGFEDQGTVNSVLDCGAQGFIPKSSNSEVMVSALRLVFAGGIYLPPQLLESNANISRKKASMKYPAETASTQALNSHTSQELTLRQLEVLSLICKGLSNKEICRKLGLAEGTVKIHVTAILKTLAVSSRTQAVLAAQKFGLTDTRASVD